MDWYFGRVKNRVKALFERSAKLIPRSLVVGRHWLFLICQPEPVYALFSKSLKRVNTLQGFLVNIHISFSFVIFRDMVLTESQLSHALEPPEFLQNNDLSKYSVYTFVFFLYFIKNIVSRRCFKPSFRVIIILIYHPRRGKLMLIALNFWCKA